MNATRRIGWSLGGFALVLFAVGLAFWLRPLSFFNAFLHLQMRLGGAQSRYVMVNGERIHYEVQGPESGQVVVLVHGLGGQAEDWRNLMPYLAHAGFRVYAPDLPGYGRSVKPVNFSYSIQDEAAAVVAFMDAMGLKQVDLGGWSMGGWIVQRIALAWPQRIQRLMIFDSAGLREAPKWNTALFTPQSAEELSKLDALLMPQPPRVPGFIARDILRRSQQSAWVIHRALASMLTGASATGGELPSLKMPVLIVWGSEDQITPLTQGEQMHKLIPQSQLDVVPGCGHLAPVQCADRIGPELVNFLR